MIGPKQIAEMIAQYTKHGWTLRRVLLSEEVRKNLGEDVGSLFMPAEVTSSDLDAAWFSRSSRPERITWELRYLGDSAFALDAFLDNGLDPDAGEEILRDTEERMRKAKFARRGH